MWYFGQDVRRPRGVASLALIAVLASVAIPGPVGSHAANPLATVSPDFFTPVGVSVSVRGSATTNPALDPGARSDGNLDQGSILLEPSTRSGPPQARPSAAQPRPGRESVSKNPWRRDPEISWYGPGLIGNGTACGKTLTRTLIGVAHRTLPSGTLVTFKSGGRTLTVPVVDRGPYVSGRIFDLTVGACRILHHCFTGSISWKMGR
jgi:rare lipoprotein A (peptidoglycan hydrolase)